MLSKIKVRQATFYPHCTSHTPTHLTKLYNHVTMKHRRVLPIDGQSQLVFLQRSDQLAGGHFFALSTYAINNVTIIPRIINMIDNISKSLISVPPFLCRLSELTVWKTPSCNQRDRSLCRGTDRLPFMAVPIMIVPYILLLGQKLTVLVP